MTEEKEKEIDCIFCGIATGITPADVVWEDEEVMFFNDISPKARMHVVGIPKKHITSMAAMEDGDQELMGKLLHRATKIAADLGVADSGYRLIANTGPDSGQEVKHVHWHLLGGEPLGPLRC